MRIEPKLRTSIVEGISVFLSLFDDNPQVKHTFCPPKEMYDPVRNADGRYGMPLPPLADLIEQGEGHRAQLSRGGQSRAGAGDRHDAEAGLSARRPQPHSRDEREPDRHWRPALFVCDEYQAFATTGENEPSGDEKFFSLARQARCIPIVATQSISSLRSTLPGESWRTLLQAFRTKIFLALSDDFSAQIGGDLCGKAERLKPSYTITEAGQDARVSMLTGRPAAHGRPSARRRGTASSATTCSSRRSSRSSRTRRPSCCLRRPQSLAADLLLPQAVLPRSGDQLLRSPRAGSALT